MSIEYRVANLDGVEEGLRRYYVQRDGAFVLDVPGVVEKGRAEELRARVDEFRETNVSQREKIEALEAKLAGFDPEEVKRLRSLKDRYESAEAAKAGEVEKLVLARVQAARAELEGKLGATASERDKALARLERMEIEGAVLKEGTGRKVRSTAVPDLLARAQGSVRVIDGAVRVVGADGKSVVYGADGVTPMTVGEWVARQATDAPHLFESNAGGGAAGAGSGGSGGRVNPFRKGPGWNMTEQMRLLKNDPGAAAALQAAAASG